MFVPSLSWQHDPFSIQMAQKCRFSQDHLDNSISPKKIAKAKMEAKMDAMKQRMEQAPVLSKSGTEYNAYHRGMRELQVVR